jgi:hypothetical protein
MKQAVEQTIWAGYSCGVIIRRVCREVRSQSMPADKAVAKEAPPLSALLIMEVMALSYLP